jgi:NADH/NAD ratio-sensing transcriptional regulator Rex
MGFQLRCCQNDRERLAALPDRLQETRLGREVFSHVGFTISATDTIIGQLQESRAEVVIVEVPSQSAQRAIRVIELIRVTTQIAIFASGDMSRPANIVASLFRTDSNHGISSPQSLKSRAHSLCGHMTNES